MLKTLFNNKDTVKNYELVKAFCAEVSDVNRPAYINFYSDDWYAEAVCKFTFRSRPIDVTLILKVQQTPNGGSKWMIMGASSRHLALSDKSPMLPSGGSCCKFLNPMSHATNFISLYRAFNDKPNIPDYLDTNFLLFPSSRSFINELMHGQLKYHFVKEIRYHFLQVPGWIFTVKQYRRKGVHAGWLISSLNKASDGDKQAYREKLMLKN
jgi:hypothetical protein